MNNYLMSANQKTKTDFYSNKKYKSQLLDKLKTDDNALNKKIDILKCDLENGFILYDKPNLLRFIQGHNEIEDFAEQFVKLYYYRENNNKFANSQELYKILYGETIGQQNWDKKIEQVKGENNPWYNHGGKYSPWSKNSVNFSEEAKKKACDNREYNTRIEYYLKKGLSEEDAKVALKERQSTFTLEKCIKRHGLKEGTRIFNDRNERWLNTLNSKPQEEIDDINRRKSSGIGIYLDHNLPGNLYYIRFFTEEIEFWKIGITHSDISGRFNLFKLKNKYGIHSELLFFNKYETIQEAYNKEQYILRNFNDSRITISMEGFYTTEAFNKNVLKGFYETI